MLLIWCMCAAACLWRSEGNLVTSVLSFTIWVPGMEFRPSGLTAKYFYLPCHPVGSQRMFLKLCVGISQWDLPVLVAPPPLCFVLGKVFPDIGTHTFNVPFGLWVELCCCRDWVRDEGRGMRGQGWEARMLQPWEMPSYSPGTNSSSAWMWFSVHAEFPASAGPRTSALIARSLGLSTAELFCAGF